MDVYHHPSIVVSTDDFIDNLPEDATNCLLCCETTFPQHHRLIRHYKQLHFQHSLVLGDFIVMSCKLYCNQASSSRMLHYHCPYCTFIAKGRERLISHCNKHSTEHANGNPASDPSLLTNRKSCQMCVLVDKNRGIYMVSKNTSERNIPIHVKKSPNDSRDLECSNAICINSMAITDMEGTVNFQCKHLKNIQALPHVEDSWYKQGYDLSALSQKEIEFMNQEYPFLHTLHTNPVVPWKVNKHSTYYSVLCSDGASQSRYSNFGRVFVHYDCKLENIHCDCCQSANDSNCLHVILVKLFIKHKSNSCPSTNRSNANLECSDVHFSSQPISGNLTEKYGIKRPLEKTNVLFPDTCPKKSANDLQQLRQIVSTKIFCPQCQGLLSEKILLTKTACVINSKSIAQNVEIYYKKCPPCNICFYFKESTDTVHLSPNIASVDASPVQEGLYLSSATGSMLNIVLEAVKTSQGKQVSETDTKLQITSKHCHTFYCKTCGITPSVLIADVCRIGISQLPVEQVEKTPNGMVQMEKFWDELANNSLLKKYLESVTHKFFPWLPDPNVSEVVSPVMTRKETKKKTLPKNEMNSKEEVLEVPSDLERSMIVQYLKNNFIVTADPSISKSKMITLMLKSSHDFDAFKEKLLGTYKGSGCWLAMSCTHGCTYAIKRLIKRESPIDYVDMILAMKHKPAILVCDLPDRIAQNFHKLNPNLHPDRRLVPLTQEDIDEASLKHQSTCAPQVMGAVRGEATPTIDFASIKEESQDYSISPEKASLPTDAASTSFISRKEFCAELPNGHHQGEGKNPSLCSVEGRASSPKFSAVPLITHHQGAWTSAAMAERTTLPSLPAMVAARTTLPSLPAMVAVRTTLPSPQAMVAVRTTLPSPQAMVAARTTLPSPPAMVADGWSQIELVSVKEEKADDFFEAMLAIKSEPVSWDDTSDKKGEDNIGQSL